MIVILHMDDDRAFWSDNVSRQTEYLAEAIGQPVKVLPRFSVPRARAVIEGSDEEMRRLLGQGYRLGAVILDLLMGGGREVDVSNWLEGIKELAESVPAQESDAMPLAELLTRMPKQMLATIDQKCPAFPVGRLAAAKGSKIVILTNVAKFLKPERLDVQAESRLLMAACGA